MLTSMLLIHFKRASGEVEVYYIHVPTYHPPLAANLEIWLNYRVSTALLLR